MTIRTLILAGIIGTSAALAAGCASTRTEQSAGEYASDAAVTTRVKAALLAEKTIKSRDINVETFRGTVQLSGFVDSSDQAAQAVTVTRKVEGVQSVKSDIRIKTAP